MLRLLHHILSRNRMTSRIQRHIVHRVKDLVNMPDGYDSVGQIYRKIKPAAILDIGSHHGYTVDKLLDTRREQRFMRSSLHQTARRCCAAE